MVEPTNELMLQILQQIQDRQADHSSRFDEQSHLLARVEKRLDEMHESMISALGWAGHANVRHDVVNERLDELTRRVEGLDDLTRRVEALERAK